MTLPTPQIFHGELTMLDAARRLLSSATLDGYLTAAENGLAGLASPIVVTLNSPAAVVIGSPENSGTSADVTPRIVLMLDRPSVWQADIAGDTYQVLSGLRAVVMLTELDAAAIDDATMYAAQLAYAHAVAACLQRYLTSATYAGAVGTWRCDIERTGADPYPMTPPEYGWSFRWSEVVVRVQFQTLLEQPETP